jgi:hypothetical protein
MRREENEKKCTKESKESGKKFWIQTKKQVFVSQ